MAKPSGKKVSNVIKLQIDAGKANPSPPVGPALGQAGLNIMDFCKSFNDKTKEMNGPIPVVITVYQDRSFDFITKLSPASYFIKKAIKLNKGSSEPGKSIIGNITMRQVKEIAEKKMADMNANDIESAAKTIAGTARSMGIDVLE